MIKLTKGQAFVLTLASTPMVAVGITGAVATYTNMLGVLGNSRSALGIVAVGEGGTLVAALVALAVTLMGQHTPVHVRAAMWLVPMLASGTGVALAKTHDEMVTMAVTPMAMTLAGEGIAFVARRVVAYRTGTDIEQQRRSGLLLWHANRAANGRGLGRWLSKAAVWRLTKAFASTDGQLSVQLGEIQRFRISQGADMNLAAVLTGEQSAKALKAPQSVPQPLDGPVAPARYAKLLEAPSSAPEGSLAGGTKPVQPSEPPKSFKEALDALADRDAERFDTLDRLADELDEVEQGVTGGLMTADDVAEALNVKPGTVRSYVNRKKLHVVTQIEGRNMFDPAEVETLRPTR